MINSPRETTPCRPVRRLSPDHGQQMVNISGKKFVPAKKFARDSRLFGSP
jgi:hypothetical protein